MMISELAKELKAANGGAVLMNKKKIMELTGWQRSQVDKITAGIQPVGSKSTYFYKDIAEVLIRRGI